MKSEVTNSIWLFSIYNPELPPKWSDEDMEISIHYTIPPVLLPCVPRQNRRVVSYTHSGYQFMKFTSQPIVYSSTFSSPDTIHNFHNPLSTTSFTLKLVYTYWVAHKCTLYNRKKRSLLLLSELVDNSRAYS